MIGAFGALGLCLMAFIPLALLVGALGDRPAGFLLLSGAVAPFLAALGLGAIAAIWGITRLLRNGTGFRAVGAGFCIVSLPSALYTSMYINNQDQILENKYQKDKIHPAEKIANPVGKINTLIISHAQLKWVPLIILSEMANHIITANNNAGRKSKADIFEIEYGHSNEYIITDVHKCSKTDWKDIYTTSILQSVGVIDKCMLSSPVYHPPQNAIAIIRQKESWLSDGQVVRKVGLLASYTDGTKLRKSTIQEWLLRCENGSKTVNEIDFLSSITGIENSIAKYIPKTAQERIKKFKNDREGANFIFIFETIKYLMTGDGTDRQYDDCSPVATAPDQINYEELSQFKEEFCSDPKIRALDDIESNTYNVRQIYEISKSDCIKIYERELSKNVKHMITDK